MMVKPLLPVELTKSFLVEAVPDIDETVRASGSECVIRAVHGDGVYWVNLLNTILLNPMTFKRVLFLLNLRTGVQVFNCHAA